MENVTQSFLLYHSSKLNIILNKQYPKMTTLLFNKNQFNGIQHLVISKFMNRASTEAKYVTPRQFGVTQLFTKPLRLDVSEVDVSFTECYNLYDRGIYCNGTVKGVDSIISLMLSDSSSTVRHTDRLDVNFTLKATVVKMQ